MEKFNICKNKQIILPPPPSLNEAECFRWLHVSLPRVLIHGALFVDFFWISGDILWLQSSFGSNLSFEDRPWSESGDRSVAFIGGCTSVWDFRKELAQLRLVTKLIWATWWTYTKCWWCWCWWNTFNAAYVPDKVLNTLLALLHLILPAILWSECYCYSHFAE